MKVSTKLDENKLASF